MAKVAIARRRAKRLAGASVMYSSELNSWVLSLYTMVNGMVAPFGMELFDNEAEAMSEADGALKTAATDWVEAPDDAVEDYIAGHTRNQWTTRQ